MRRFDYPTSMRSTTKISMIDSRVGFEFWVHAEYREDYFCACECCVFEQYAKSSGSNNFEEINTGDYRQDAVFGQADKGGVRQTVLEDPPPGWTVFPFGGVGGDMTVRPNEKSSVRADAMHPGCSICDHWYYDSPGRDVRLLWDIRWDFVGAVFDRCANWEIRRIGHLWWRDFAALFGSGHEGGAEDGDGRMASVSDVPPPNGPPSNQGGR